MKNRFLLLITLSSLSLFAQEDLINKVINNASLNSKYEFKDVINLQNTSIKNQGKAGTCWSYSGNSFIESEMIRMGKTPVDLAEIFTARQVYLSKARNYILFNGSLSLGDGGEIHDVLNIIRKYGAMPQEACSLENYGNGTLKSKDFQDKFKAILDDYMKDENPSKGASWVENINKYLDDTFGKVPESFTYNGKVYTPKTFASEVVGIKPDDYIEFASYIDSPYYSKIVSPMPDNWNYDLAYNVPMTELTDIIDFALQKGFTVGWSTDVSEPYFSWKNGVAIVPNLDLNAITDEQKKTLFDGPNQEKVITDDLRLEGIYSLKTTDDHAMQIVGLAKDQNGKEYYKIKNSWGETNQYKGYLYASKAFVQLKTMILVINKGGVSKSMKTKINYKG